MTGIRKDIHPATQAALWALSNGRCYAPNCPFPILFEVRPGVYRKNVHISHIFGVRPGATRYRSDLPNAERDSFTNLLLFCLPHHAEVDDPKTGEKLYPPELLREWKTDHEGRNGPALAVLGPVDEERLMAQLAQIFESPIQRLEKIAKKLEDTGHLTGETIAELRQITSTLANNPPGPDAATARALAYAAEVFSRRDLNQASRALAHAADTLKVRDLERVAQRLVGAAEQLRRY